MLGYNHGMSAKEALHVRIERLTEDEAVELLAQLEWDSSEFDELSPDEMAEALAGRQENERGESVDGEDLFRRLGL